ncbi:tRNA lysidine(34) synthetase TilS [Betaproteobacteria bacterium SCN1]|nr:tRNA lysidine(34) synthetase TilS [Betaproteobacteria bacterium SCN1]
MADMVARHVPAGARLLLGFSGGLDSSVLLHVLAALRARHPFALAAVHVHHGLSPNADAWADFCVRMCAAHAVPLTLARVRVDCDDPAGIEGAARQARRHAFEACSGDFLLTAQHRDDQAETFLLQALRGAGPKGLAAMAECRRPSGSRLVHLRPLLAVSREDLHAAACAAGIEWVEDESNADTLYRRNALRHRVLPALREHFPAAGAALARAAAHQAEAAGLLDELARLDAAGSLTGERLDCAALAALPRARARNLLRYFLAGRGARMPGARRLDEALRQVCDARADAQVRVALENAELRRYRGGAYVVGAIPSPEPQVWLGEPALTLPGLGTLHLRRETGRGLPAEALVPERTVLDVRRGGERLRLAAGAPTRNLKTLLQACALPPWERERLPVLRLEGAVLWAAGFGVNADWQVTADAPGWMPDWRPAAADSA